jgi:hypothetical protein
MDVSSSLNFFATNPGVSVPSFAPPNAETKHHLLFTRRLDAHYGAAALMPNSKWKHPNAHKQGVFAASAILPGATHGQ